MNETRQRQWKAWRVYVQLSRWDCAIVWNTSRARAMWFCVRGFCDAFDVSPRVALEYIKIRRAPRYDFEGEEPDPMMVSESELSHVAAN